MTLGLTPTIGRVWLCSCRAIMFLCHFLLISVIWDLNTDSVQDRMDMSVETPIKFLFLKELCP